MAERLTKKRAEKISLSAFTDSDCQCNSKHECPKKDKHHPDKNKDDRSQTILAMFSDICFFRILRVITDFDLISRDILRRILYYFKRKLMDLSILVCKLNNGLGVRTPYISSMSGRRTVFVHGNDSSLCCPGTSPFVFSRCGQNDRSDGDCCYCHKNEN